jgi:hypothetical protein
VARIRAGIAALQATGRKITADSIKQVTWELEPGSDGLSSQVIRRNPRAYALYREVADGIQGRTDIEQETTEEASTERLIVAPATSLVVRTHCNDLKDATWCCAFVVLSATWMLSAASALP